MRSREILTIIDEHLDTNFYKNHRFNRHYFSLNYGETFRRNSVTAFVNVNVVPMHAERMLPNQIVIIKDGMIVEIGDADKTRIPANALKINGRGK